MKREALKDGMRVHYTSIIGRGPSVPVTVSGEPYRLGGGRQWSVWVKSEENTFGFCVSIEAIYKKPIAAGVDLRAKSRMARSSSC